MSETERTVLLLDRVRKTLAKSRETSPEQRFQKMVDAGLISADGKLRREGSAPAKAGATQALKK
jgi:hypothetical protein